MLSQIIHFSLENRFLVITLTLLVAISGAYTALHLPIDAVPDMTNVQVQVITRAGSLSPVEVERYVTNPVEMAMAGLPDREELRSISKFGLSSVTIVFREGTDIFRARQSVAERLPDAVERMPAEFHPSLGPLTTALGEVLQFEVRGEGYSATELRTFLEWDIAPKMREVSGVTEINTHGGYYKTFEVRPDPERLLSLGIPLDELFEKLRANNLTRGGGYVVHHDEQRFIRGVALLTGPADIEQIVIRRAADGTPILLRDLGSVAIAPMTRQGAVTRDARGEAVIGMVMMTIGENSREVVERAKVRLEEIQLTLPARVRLEVIYDRADLIQRTLHTVVKNLLEGGVLVILVLLLMLGSFRAGLIVALAIPLAMLFASNLMYFSGVTASLMSLGAIDFGLLVDSSVIMIENCMHRLPSQPAGRSRVDAIRDAAIEVREPTMFGELIIAMVYVPILALQGTEGKLFKPMALTVLFALCGSLILSLTFMPAIASLALPRQVAKREVFLLRWLRPIYNPLVAQAVRFPGATAVIAICLFLVSIPVAWRMGAEFMPRLDEGDILIEANRLPSSSLEGSLDLSTRIEQELKQFPELKTVFCKTGQPEIANDVMGVQQTDVWAMLKPHHEWPRRKTRDELVQEMADVLNERIPGAVFAFTQPIEMRVDELVAGVKADVAVLLYGDDLSVLNHQSRMIERLLRGIPGAVDVKTEYTANLSTLRIEPRREALARYGVNAERVMDVVAAMGGEEVGQIYEGRRRFPILVRIPEAWRKSVSLLEQLPVSQVGGKPIPLKELADITVEETPPSVEHELGRRRTYIQCNVRGRDMGSFVAEAQRVVAAKIRLPAGYELRWGGDFENLQTASLRLMIITPIVLLIILLLLHTTFKSMRLALLIFLAVPIAASGGIFALTARGMPFSISAGIGFIALFGVAVLNGLVWVSSAEDIRKSGLSPREASLNAANARLRPVLMTALVASLGFVPMALSTTDGSELQKPLATVVIGGIITSTLLTSLVIPAIYPWFISLDPLHVTSAISSSESSR